MTTETNLEREYGETWQLDFAFTEASGVDMDLTGATVTLILENRRRTVKAIISGDQVDLETPASSGEGVVEVLPADYSAFAPGLIAYAFKVVLSDGRIEYPARGWINAERPAGG